MAPTPETVLAGLPRVVRVADESRWRGQSSVATALVLGAFWGFTWLLGEPVEVARTAVSFGAVLTPTLLVAGLASGRRIRENLAHTRRPPVTAVHETAAASRDRRMRLATVVLFGIIALLIFDRFTDGGGVMAGLVAGLMLGVGVVDWREARLWRHAERERDSRLFVLVRPRALMPTIAATEVFESPNTGSSGPLEMPVDHLDLG